MGQQQQGPDLELIIKDLQRRMKDLENAPRVPQISDGGQNMTAVSENSGTTGRAPATWGDRTIAPPVGTIGIRVPASGRVLFSFGCYMGALTAATAFGYWDLVACGLLVKSAADPLTVPSTIINNPQDRAAYVYVEGTTTVPARLQVSAMNAFVLEGLTGHHLSVDMQFLRSNIQSTQTYLTWPWMTVQPL